MLPFREGELHPLQNPVILEMIFKGSRLKDLKAYRQVCKAWVKESSKAMRESSKVQIIGTFYRKNEVPGVRGQAAFMALVGTEASTFNDAPFAETFVLRNLTSDVPNFWELCGSRIKSLKLLYVEFKTKEDFREAIFLGCPNLEDLEIYCCTVHGTVQPEPIDFKEPRYPQNRKMKTLVLEGALSGVMWMDLLVHFPSIEALTWRQYGWHCRPEAQNKRCDGLFRSLGVVRRRDSQNLNLKCLEMDIEHYPQPLELVTILVDGHLQLETLVIKGIQMPRDAVPLQQILEGHAGSLRKLELYGVKVDYDDGEIEQKDIFPLPKNSELLKLEKLVIGSATCESMSFLRFVPNLRNLCLRGDWLMIRNTNWEEMGNFVLSSCVQLYLNTDNGSSDAMIQAEDLRKVSSWLPNIQHLWVGFLSNETFAVLCQGWPKLKTLKLNTDEMDCSGFTGFDKKDVRRINREDENGSWRPITVPRANITALNELENLILIMSCRQLDYCSVVYGIQRLPKLQQLKVERLGRNLYGLIWNDVIDQFPWVNDDFLDLDYWDWEWMNFRL